ncbi:hypothetical protein KA068_00575 [Candidatus Saccharibacteria bacterium]|jgi:hypothetical protein|nr:hypothetical protein [Candidatus Saccharibacteria bacterium]
MIKKLIETILSKRHEERNAELYRNLIRHEARIGGELFGPVPEGHHREFFCLDEHTWVWHEEWMDAYGQHQTATTRYDVRPGQVLKSQNGQYSLISENEARHLRDAVILYQQRVNQELYSFVA